MDHYSIDKSFFNQCRIDDKKELGLKKFYHIYKYFQDTFYMYGFDNKLSLRQILYKFNHFPGWKKRLHKAIIDRFE